MSSSSMFLLVLLAFLIPTSKSTTFTILNSCGYTVWPGLLSGAGTSQLPTTGFILNSGESTTIPLPTSWSGRLWGRTHCTTDPATNKFTCLTGDCGSSTLSCSGAGANPPATLVEFTLNGANNLDFYDVSLVDGYNLPILISPSSTANCTATGCAGDLNTACPNELKVTSADGSNEGVACKSACEAFGDEKYCCSGAYATPDTCKPSEYSEMFKSACPRAYSYAYDDGTSTFTCEGADYVITFCPTPANSQKSANPVAVINSTMVYGSGGAKVASGPSVSVMTAMMTLAVLIFFNDVSALFASPGLTLTREMEGRRRFDTTPFEYGNVLNDTLSKSKDKKRGAWRQDG